MLKRIRTAIASTDAENLLVGLHRLDPTANLQQARAFPTTIHGQKDATQINKAQGKP
jgi:hypothetical protein